MPMATAMRVADMSPMAQPRANAGFTLMELAIVLMIIGTLMSGVLVAVGQSMRNTRITDAKAQLREIEEALYGYAQAYGRLPCPATNVSDGLSSTVTNDITGDCTHWHGFVPISTLGLYGPVNTDGLLMDPWQNPVRYSVAPLQYSGQTAFTNATSLGALFDAAALSSTNMLRVCYHDDCLVDEIHSDIVPALVFSMGDNWASYTSDDEIMNAGSTTLGTYAIKPSTDRDFVNTTYSEENFDDQIVWLSPYVLFNRLINAGKLPVP
jgi:prepilin-type N-terminal cleavage/methylation domain-containing protein